MFHANVVKIQEAHFILCLFFFRKKQPILKNVKDTTEGHKPSMKIMKI